jgi:CheY-like chemotaxis protein
MTRVINIAYIDDESMAADTVDGIVNSYNNHNKDSGVHHSLDLFECGKDYLKVHEPGKHDLLIVDKTLPGISGIDVVKAVRRKEDDMPIILFTGYNNLQPGSDIDGIPLLPLPPLPLKGSPLPRGYGMYLMTKPFEAEKLMGVLDGYKEGPDEPEHDELEQATAA